MSGEGGEGGGGLAVRILIYRLTPLPHSSYSITGVVGTYVHCAAYSVCVVHRVYRVANISNFLYYKFLGVLYQCTEHYTVYSIQYTVLYRRIEAVSMGVTQACTYSV